MTAQKRCEHCGWKSHEPYELQNYWLRSWELHETLYCPALEGDRYMTPKFKRKDTVYWYQAAQMSRGDFWKVEKVQENIETGYYRINPVAEFLTEKEAKDAVASGLPLRFLGERGRRRGPDHE